MSQRAISVCFLLFYCWPFSKAHIVLDYFFRLPLVNDNEWQTFGIKRNLKYTIHECDC